MKRISALMVSLVLSIMAANVSAQDRPQEPGVGAAVAAFEMEYVKRSPDEVLKRAQRLGQLFTGKRLALGDAAKQLAQPADVRWHAVFSDAPQLLVRYLPQVDEIRLLDSETTRDLTSEPAIDEAGALKLARRYLDGLASARLIDLRHYDLKRAQIGYHKALSGSHNSERPEFERITEYRVTLRPAINGIEVATAGVRLGIHMSGRLVGLRIGGATVKTLPQGMVDVPVGKGKYLTRLVPDEVLDKRFAEAALKVDARQTHWSRLVYAMPEGAAHAVVEPQRVYAYTDIQSVDGERVPARRKIIGYSITDAGAAPVDYTAPSKPVDETQRQ
jgi:hypothetical protein